MHRPSPSCRVGRRPRPSATAALPSMLLLLSALLQIQCSDGFATLPATKAPATARHSLQNVLPLFSEVETSSAVDASASDEGDEGVNAGLPKLTGALEGTELKEFELANHKPLGCSVEESLASEPDGAKYVFVSELTEGGNAMRAGIRVGDVIVQLSGTFDEVVDVAGLGIEKIRSLVAGRPEESPLKMRVARGSDVVERHELSLVELCIVGDDASTNECIATIYASDDDVYMPGDGDMPTCDEDEDAECMLDSMWDSWSDGLVEPAEEEEVVEEKTEKKKKVQPWSSRASPSGTYVRDPKTGKLVNIDE